MARHCNQFALTLDDHAAWRIVLRRTFAAYNTLGITPMATRDHILTEIRRIAGVAGGKPPGWRLFAKETGLREWDWKERFWARWGDALVEAGFQPNKLNEPYPEEHLLDAYAQIVRRLGHLPTEAELRLAEKEYPETPGYQAFGRFGTKAALVAKLVAFCEARGDLVDVLALGQAYVPPKGRNLDPAEGTVQAPDEFVYLIRSGRFFKIGRSNAAGRRERELAIQLPEATRMVHVIRTDDPVGIEAYWHNRFAEKRKNGEWFELSAIDVATFKRRKFM